MFGTFSGSALAAVGRAEECAADRNGFEISAEDVVLAVTQLVAPTKGSLAALVEALATPKDVDPANPPNPADADQLGRLKHSDFTDRIPGQQIPFSESAIATFRAAWKKAKWDGRKQVDEYDLLTGALEQPALAAARRAAGIDLDAVRAVISGLRQPV
ncbi:MAG: hypothetical protein ABWZ02_07330 [Nakamurella sp.]